MAVGRNKPFSAVPASITNSRRPIFGHPTIEFCPRLDADGKIVFVYHPHYVDAIAVRYWNKDGSSGNVLEEEHYFLQDANFNVTAVIDNTGAVIERYAYTPYGEVTILDLNFLAVSGNVSTISNEHLYTGRRQDPGAPGLQLNRNRFYASGLGRWVNRDPIGYEGGGDECLSICKWNAFRVS